MSISETGTGKSGSFRQLHSWLLIVFLSLIPGFIFLWDWSPEGEEATSLVALSEGWFKQSDMLAQRFYEASEKGFWAKEFAGDFRQMAAGLSEKLPYEEALNQAFAVKSSRFPLEPLGIFFTSQNNGSNWKVFSSAPVPAVSLFKQLFAQVYAYQLNGISDLSSKVWEQRIKTLLGPMAFAEMFLSANRQKAYPVIFQKRSWYLVWDFLPTFEQSIDRAGFIILVPADFQKSLSTASLIIQNWSTVAGSSNGEIKPWPALVSLENPDKLEIIMHQELENPSLRADLEKFVGRHFRKNGNNQSSTIAGMPSEMTGRSFFIGNKIVRICYSMPESGFCGLLIADSPRLTESLRRQVAGWYLKLLAFFWGVFLVRILIFKRLPPVSINLRVLVWFLAFAAFPAGLTVGAWTAIMQEFRDLKVLRLQRDLNRLALNIDAEVGGLSQLFLQASRKTIGEPGLQSGILRLASEPDLEGQVFSQIRTGFAKEKIEPLALILVVQGGWCFSEFSREAAERFQKSTRMLLGSLLDKFLEQAAPDLYRKFKPTGNTAGNSRRVHSLADVADFKIYKNFGAVRDRFDNVSGFLSGSNYTLQFYHQINFAEKPFAIFVALWEPEKRYSSILKKALPAEAVRFRKLSSVSPDIAIFKGSGNNMRLIHATGNRAGFEKITQFSTDRIAFFSDSENACILMPSQRMPGYTILVRAAIHGINMQVLVEQFWMLISLILIGLSILGGVLWVYVWVSRPLRNFIPALAAIRSGQNSAKMLDIREDEVGAMGLTIQRMANWIIEREKIKKFVAPQAIKAIADGNFIKAGAGSVRQAIILVSDIRSFTTISEEYQAEMVFDMVNHHLGEMAKIIEARGGFIDRFVGDAVWAVFYEDERSQANAAFTAAVEMMRKHLDIQTEREGRGLFTVNIGIGLVRGSVLAGVMGNSAVRLDYTIVGETLQTAEEVESASKSAQITRIIFDKSLHEDAQKLGVRFSTLPDSENLFEVNSLA